MSVPLCKMVPIINYTQFKKLEACMRNIAFMFTRHKSFSELGRDSDVLKSSVDHHMTLPLKFCVKEFLMDLYILLELRIGPF